MSKKIKQFILLGGDVIILYFSLYLTLSLRYAKIPSPELWQSHFIPFTLVFFFWLLIFYISDLYNLNFAVNNIRFYQLTSRSLLISSFLSVAFFYIIPQINIAPKRNMLIYVVVFAILFILWRRLYNWLLKSYLPKINIAIIGFNKQVEELINELKLKKHLGYNILAIIDPDNKLGHPIENIKIIKNITYLPETIVQLNLDWVILATNIHDSEELQKTLFKTLSKKINLISLTNFYEIITGKISLETINQVWFLENLNKKNMFFFDFFKRTYDLILSTVFLLFIIVLYPIIGLLIKLETKGPIFFKQKRLGKNGQIFNIIKFRTMSEDSNDRTPTAADDKRITRLGQILRKTRIDELPQVINILKSEMSFVGPRPERPDLAEELEKQVPYYRQRLLAKPGATGWDQISGEYHSPSVEDSLKKLQYDLFYIKNRSIYLDLSIILKTIATILSRKGM